MKRNIGDIDADIRIMISFFLAYFYFITSSPTRWQTIGVMVAAILMITAIVGNCPLYRIFGIDTCNGNACGECPHKKHKKDENK
jgi:hypothetical protein